MCYFRTKKKFDNAPAPPTPLARFFQQFISIDYMHAEKISPRQATVYWELPRCTNPVPPSSFLFLVFRPHPLLSYPIPLPLESPSSSYLPPAILTSIEKSFLVLLIPFAKDRNFSKLFLFRMMKKDFWTS
jgi:hypothetical protein